MPDITSDIECQTHLPSSRCVSQDTEVWIFKPLYVMCDRAYCTLHGDATISSFWFCSYVKEDRAHLHLQWHPAHILEMKRCIHTSSREKRIGQYYSKLGKLHGSREGGITLFLLFIYHSFTKTRQKKSLAAGYSCKAARPRPGLLAFIHPQKASWNPKKLGSGSMGRERLFVTCPSAKALPYYDWA